MIDLNQLQQFAAVAKCGTLSSAAERLFISQPALTRSMQKLENDLGVPLFDRARSRISLNENGRFFLDIVRSLLSEADSCVERVRAFDRSRRTIAVGSCAPAPLWEIVPALTGLYPDWTISSEMRENDVLLQGLRSGVYQFIILPYPAEGDGLFCIRYGEEHLYFSLPPAHPLSGSRTLRMRDLNGETMLLRNRLGFWRDIADRKMPDTRFLEQFRD